MRYRDYSDFDPDGGVLWNWNAVRAIAPPGLKAAGWLDFHMADLGRADLTRADLRGVLLVNANLHRARLCDADLHCADLSGANLSGANLSDANLSGANLSGADLYGADLHRTNFSCANLNMASLLQAHLVGTNFYGASMSGVILDTLAAARLSICPEEGAFVGWKKCRNNVIVKLEIPAEARRSNATSRKCRADFVKVLEVIGAGPDGVGESVRSPSTNYRVGEIVYCNNWDGDRWRECSGGIHFFITRAEAEAYVY